MRLGDRMDFSVRWKILVVTIRRRGRNRSHAAGISSGVHRSMIDLAVSKVGERDRRSQFEK
jgi:hypothetical protein